MFIINKTLRNKNFMLLSIGSFISCIGDFLYNIGLTIYLYNITNSINSIALMWLSRGILRIPVQYLSGVIADEYNKRKIIIYSNLISVPIAFSLIFVNEKNLWIAFIIAFLLQSLNDIDMCSENAIFPHLVLKNDLAYCNSIFSFLGSISIFLSPALGGIIYKFLGIKTLFIINSLSFLTAGILFTFIKYNHQKTIQRQRKIDIFKSGIEGLKILYHYKNVKLIFSIVSIYAILGRFYEIYKVAVSDVLLNLNAEGIIYFNYSLALGGLLVPFLIKLLSKHKDILIFLLSTGIISISYIIFGYSHNYVITLSILIVLGLCESIQSIYCKTIIQKNIPKEYLGRIFSSYKMLLTLFSIIGILSASPLYNSIGIGNSFLLMSILLLVLCGLSLKKIT
ncbi:MFS transporter [Haloimpatiens sp. FM7330]|uniref:MFS transporter n=1 Tax=Haloimpatiens sp. FM7330 TaxID=3298610 RepID=UPI0036345D7E